MKRIDERYIKECIFNERVAMRPSRSGNDYVASGFSEIDKRHGGFVKGESYLIIGEPSIGLTSLAINIWSRLIHDTNHFHGVAFVSTSHSDREIMDRLVKAGASIGAADACTDIKLSEQYMKELEMIGQSFSYFEDKFFESLDQIFAACRNCESKIDLIVIDDIQNVRDYLKNNNSFMDRVKLLAMELGCTVIMTAHTGNAVRNRIDHHPILSDAYDICDVNRVDHIWSIYRDDFYYEDSSYKGIAEIGILSPSCEEDRIELAWIPDIGKFGDVISVTNECET